MTVSTALLPEWTPQSGVILTWPHRLSDWAPSLQTIEPVYCALIQAISERQLAFVIAYDTPHLQHVKQQLTQAGVNLQNCRFAVAATNDTWVRDYGPIAVAGNSHPRLLKFTFNGWGGKYDAQLDNSLVSRLANTGFFKNADLEEIDLVLEGGSIDTDGAGTLLTTSSCLLSPTRNPQLDKRLLELKLRRYLGIKRVVWLHNSFLAGDDTDGHVDMLARFCNSRTIAYTACEDPDDEHYNVLQELRCELESAFPAKKNYRLVPLPIPAPILGQDGQRLPASYANFLIINSAVLVPCYGDTADQTAIRRLKRAFPTRQLIRIDCRALLEQRGSLHCATMQLPRGVLTKKEPKVETTTH